MGSAGVSPAVFGVPPKTSGERTRTFVARSRTEPIGETPIGATGTVALPKLFRPTR